MLQLEETLCLITNVNARAEKHGDENVIACDVNLRADIPAEQLNDFSTGLRDVYYKNARTSQQPLIEGQPLDAELRFPGLFEPIRLKSELSGYAADISWGDLASSTLVDLVEVKVHKIVLEPKVGGTVELSLQLQAHPTSQQIGDLCALIQKEVTVDLLAPIPQPTTGEDE